MAEKKNMTDAELALAEGAEKKISEKLDLMRTRLNMLEKINPDLPGAIKTALKAQSDKTSVALYKHDIENNQTTYVTGSMAMLWSIDEPLEALYDRLAKGYVREAGHYIVKLIFSKINPEIPDIEIPVCLEPPYAEPAPAAVPVIPEPENKTSEFVDTMVQMMQAQQEQHREDLEKMLARLDAQAPKEDPVIKMISEQNRVLIEALTKRNDAPAPVQQPATMADMIGSMKDLMELTGKARDLTGSVAAPIKAATDGVSDVLSKLKELSDLKKTVDGLFGGNLDREVQAGAAQIVTNERNWGTVLMNLVEKFGDKALPTITTMLGKAVVNAAQKDIDELARQGAQPPARPAAAPVATARPLPPRNPAPQRSAPQPVQPAAPSAPPKDNVIPFPGLKEATAAKFREIISKSDQPAPPPSPVFLPAEERENANLPELLEEMALDMADPGFVQHGPDGETYANWVADELDRLMPGWWEMYHEKPVDEVVTELKDLCYAQCPALQQHDQKMTQMIRDLHDTAKRIAQEESEGGAD